MRPDCATVTGMAPSPERGRRVPAIIVHGGAGASPAERDELYVGMRAAVQAGWAALAAGGTSLDAVEQAVRVLEDHEHFNAGRGSALTAGGRVEMDASIMEGDRLRCGADGARGRHRGSLRQAAALALGDEGGRIALRHAGRARERLGAAA